MHLEDRLHYVARLFMEAIATKDMDQTLSLDEFLIQYKNKLTDEQLELGLNICVLFEEI